MVVAHIKVCSVRVRGACTCSDLKTGKGGKHKKEKNTGCFNFARRRRRARSPQDLPGQSPVRPSPTNDDGDDVQNLFLGGGGGSIGRGAGDGACNG